MSSARRFIDSFIFMRLPLGSVLFVLCETGSECVFSIWQPSSFEVHPTTAVSRATSPSHAYTVHHRIARKKNDIDFPRTLQTLPASLAVRSFPPLPMSWSLAKSLALTWRHTPPGHITDLRACCKYPRRRRCSAVSSGRGYFAACCLFVCFLR